MSLRTLLRSPRHPVHAHWKQRVLPQLGELNLRLLPALVDAPVVPHFLQPPPAAGNTFEHELDMIAGLPPEQIATELGWAFGDPARRNDPDAVVPGVLLPLLTEPEPAVERLMVELREYWALALAPAWLKVEDFLLADVDRRGRRVPFAAAGSMNSAYAFAGDQLTVTNRHIAPTALPGASQGWLVATVFSWPNDNSIVCDAPGIAWSNREPMLPYAPKGFANVWRDDRVPGDDALASVFGSARAKIMALLVKPTSTSEVARALAMTAGGASQQLALLHRAGLADRSREGHAVYYRLSRRGRHLLALFDDSDDA